MPSIPESRKAATRADVARMAGVSVTIVSYVLNNNRYVAEDKRQRVLAAVEALRYQPNRFARGLRGKGTNHIVFIADQISNEHFGQIVQYMDEFAYDNGYMISLCTNRDTDAFIDQIITRAFDGAVISSTNFQERHVRKLVSAGVHVVLLNQRQYGELPPEVGRIDTGLYDGAVQAMEHLLSLGRKRVVYVDRCSQHGRFSTIQDFRYRAYLDLMHKNALLPRIVTGCARESDVVSAVRACAHEVDAFFARNDRLATLVLHALREEGLRVPDDILVTGFDNSQLSRYTQPALTTVEIDRAAVARAAIGMLDAMIHGQAPENRSVPTRLIVRESTVSGREDDYAADRI